MFFTTQLLLRLNDLSRERWTLKVNDNYVKLMRGDRQAGHFGFGWNDEVSFDRAIKSLNDLLTLVINEFKRYESCDH
jgi:hypothetical protein